jgi:DNA-binding NarL/FixJ family response regulator
MPIHLAVVDGQTLIRYGLRELVAQQPDIEIVAESQSAADAAAMVAEVRPDVVTVDVTLPDGDGLRLARELRNCHADLGIVMLTSQHEDDLLFRALECRLSAFVAKTAPLEEVLSAIRHAAVAASCFTASGLATAVARRRSMQDRLALSPRETEVLRLLNDGLSVPAIASQMFISVSTAKTYVARLYEKLGAANRAQALMAALHHGLIQYHQDTSSEAATCDGGRNAADRRHSPTRPLALVGTNPEVAGEARGEPVNGARELRGLSISAR